MATNWCEAGFMAVLIALRHILLGHFEERTAKWQILAKLFGSIGLAVLISATLGRGWFFFVFGLCSLLVIAIHARWLPKRANNGWTGELKERYPRLRGWGDAKQTTRSAEMLIKLVDGCFRPRQSRSRNRTTAAALWRLGMLLGLVGGVVGCGQPTGNYELVVADVPISLPLHQDAVDIQDDIVAHLKPLWETLKTGESDDFYLTRTVPVESDLHLPERRSGWKADQIQLLSARTESTSRLRFFKGRDGMDGIECIDELKGNWERFVDSHVTWEVVEQVLRRIVYNEEMIRVTLKRGMSDFEPGAESVGVPDYESEGRSPSKD